jgi:hypothetical protein
MRRVTTGRRRKRANNCNINRCLCKWGEGQWSIIWGECDANIGRAGGRTNMGKVGRFNGDVGAEVGEASSGANF